MAHHTRARTVNAIAPDVTLPPPFTLVTMREVGDAFVHASEIAAEQGAGTLVYVGRFDLAEFAVVLEPDEPLRTARRVFYAGMVAIADALATYAQPDTPIRFEWPDAITVNEGLVGGGRLGWPKGADENEPPDWLVFGGMIRTVSMTGEEPGVNPLSTALEHEGFTDYASGELVASFARHLMVATDTWQERGFEALAKEFVSRLTIEKSLRRDIDENGDLLVRRMGKVDAERKQLLPALAAPSWLDTKTGGPRL